MKYQIYLNKETSKFIEVASQKDNKKPCTLIKEIVESVYSIAKATAEQTEKELTKNG